MPNKKEDSDQLIVVDAERYHKVKQALEDRKSVGQRPTPGLDEKESTRELVVVDVKRYKKVKKALAESEERYRQLFENVPIGIYRTTPDGRIVDSNPALVQMLGYETFAELSRRNLETDFSDAGYKRSDFIKLLKSQREIKGLESIWKRKDGSPIYVRENAKLVRNEAGEVFFEGTVEDITQSKLAEEAQRVRTRQIEILNCIISKGNLARSQAEMLEVVLDCVTQPLDFDTAAIFIFDPVTKTMNQLAARGVKKDYRMQEKYMAVNNPPFANVLRGELVFVDRASERLPDLAGPLKLRMVASVPLVSKGIVVGALNVGSRRRDRFAPEEKATLEMIGKEAGTLISKLQTETTLRDSEEKFRSIAEQTGDLIAITDAEGIITYVSSAVRVLFRCEPDEMIGRLFTEFLDGESVPRALAAFRQDQASGERTVNLELTIRRKDGTLFTGELNGSNFQYGGRRGSLVVIRDISERCRADEQLRFLGSITENTSEAIIVTDTDFRITYVNKVAEAFFGYTFAELSGKTPDIFNAEANARQIQERLYQLVAAGETYLGESLNRRKDGSTFYCEYKVMPLRDAKGEIYAFSSVQRDISERKLREAELRQSEESFRLTFASIPSPAYVWERQADGRILLSRCNHAAEAITHGKVKDFLGIELDVLYADSPEFAAKIKRTMNRGGLLSEEVEYRFRCTGESKWLVVDYVRTAPGNVLVITRDVSDRKEAETKLIAYQAQLRALSSELALTEEKERRRIAAELHDQIGQNLALCKLKVNALEKECAGDAVRAELSAVRRLLECSIQDARSLILDLSPPVLYELGLAAALEWLAERIEGQYGVQLEFENRRADVSLESDLQVILFQVVRELLVNVGKHSQARRAKVILAQQGGDLQIQVNDDGVGFDVATAFDARDPKAGFGFFSMRERLSYLGGSMEVRSRPGQGSQIFLNVPQAPRENNAKKENP